MSHILLIGIHGSEEPTRRPACWGLVQGFYFSACTLLFGPFMELLPLLYDPLHGRVKHVGRKDSKWKAKQTG